MDHEERDWQAEGDLDTLVRADEIKKDPSRMGRIKVVAERRAEIANKMVGSVSKGDESDLSKGYRKIK